MLLNPPCRIQLMLGFIVAESLKQISQRMQVGPGAEVDNLFGVMAFDERLNRRNGSEDAVLAKHGGARSEQPAGSPPGWHQPAVRRAGQPIEKEAAMPDFCPQMLFRKAADAIISGNGEDAAVNGHRAVLAGKIGSQVCDAISA